MMMNLIIHSSQDKKIYNFNELAYDIQLNTELGVASKLSFSYLKNGFQAPNGSLVIFSYEDKVLFKGFIFTSTNDLRKISVVCYDQIKYFQNKDSFIIENQKASSVLELIVNKQQLEKGTIENTEVVLASQIFQNKSYLDILNECLDQTLIASRKKFILRDEEGKVCLRNIESLKTDVILGTKSLAKDYSYEKSIENETYNQIKLVKKNKNVLENFIVKDSQSINKWGLLQYYEEVNENLDDSLIKKKAEDLLKLYNKEQRKLIFNDSSLNVKCIAGNLIRVFIENLGIDQYCIIKSSTFNFKGDKRMDVEVIL